MPQSCNDDKIFEKKIASLQYKVNYLVDFIKTLIDVDKLHDMVGPGID